MNRRSITLILALVLGVSVLGAAPSVAAQDPVTITFWTHTHPPMVDLNEKLIAEYEAQNPHVTIEYEVIPNMEFGHKMLVSLSTGTGPDIINMDDGALRSVYIPRDLVVPLDYEAMGYSSIDELQADWLPGAFAGAEVDGVIHGVPSEFNVTSFGINTAHFREVGLDPTNPPRTWDEVVEYGKALNVTEGGRSLRRGFDFPYLHAGWYNKTYEILLMQTGGQVIDLEGNVRINEPEAVEALHIWYDMVHEHNIANPHVATRESTVPAQDVIDERISMWLTDPWVLGLLEGTPEVYDNFEITPVPQVDPDNPATRLYAYYWAVNQTASNPEEAWKFISFMASHPERWLVESNFIQPRRGWTDSPEAQDFPFLDVWMSEFALGEFGYTHENYTEIIEAVKRAIERSVIEGMEPQRSLDMAKTEIERIVD